MRILKLAITVSLVLAIGGPALAAATAKPLPPKDMKAALSPKDIKAQFATGKPITGVSLPGDKKYSLMLNAERVTLTTNGPGATSPEGQINLLSTGILWPTSTPRLQYLTNWGAINCLNAVFFGGSRGSPFFNTTFNEPYIAFVNRGGITNHGSQIWATYFENTGTFDAGLGAVSLQGSSVLLSNGLFRAVNNDISIQCNDLVVTNHPLLAGAAFAGAAVGGGLLGGAPRHRLARRRPRARRGSRTVIR